MSLYINNNNNNNMKVATLATLALASATTSVYGAAMTPKTPSYMIATKQGGMGYAMYGDFTIGEQGPFSLHIDSGSSNLGVRGIPYDEQLQCKAPYLDMQCTGEEVASTYQGGSGFFGTGCTGSFGVVSNTEEVYNSKPSTINIYDQAEFFRIEKITGEQTQECGDGGIIGFAPGSRAKYGQGKTGLSYLLDAVEKKVWAYDVCKHGDYVINANATTIDNQYIFHNTGSVEIGGYDDSEPEKMDWIPMTSASEELGYYCVQAESLRLEWTGSEGQQWYREPVVFSGDDLNGNYPKLNSECNALFDTGNPNIVSLPTPLYEVVQQYLKINGQFIQDPSCITSADFKIFPDIVVRFTNGKEISVSPKEYAMLSKSNPQGDAQGKKPTPDNVCWAILMAVQPIESNIQIGHGFMQKYYSVYDMENKQIGVKTSTCHNNQN